MPGHQVDILQSQVVVYKDGGCYRAFLGECPFQLCDEVYLHQNYLINTNTLSRLCCPKHFGGGLTSFPGYFGHSTKEASCTGRRLDLGQSLWDLFIESKLLELGEGQVAEAETPAHEFGLVVDSG
jgi:hypothetical protein